MCKCADDKLQHPVSGMWFFRNFGDMSTERTANISVENHIILSEFLEREVKVDFYLPVNASSSKGVSLLLINDGQDLQTMHFDEILEELYEDNAISALLCVGIHCGKDRKNEYGTAKNPYLTEFRRIAPYNIQCTEPSQ